MKVFEAIKILNEMDDNSEVEINFGEKFRDNNEQYNLKCDADCSKSAEYEGWYRVVDGMGVKTGLIQRMNVCKNHRSFLIGKEKKR